MSARRLLAVLAALLFLAAPASADTGSAQVTHIERDSRGLQLLVSVPASASVDLSKVGVTINGTAAQASAATAGAANDVRRTTILAIDTSGSMAGPKIAAAKAAADQFLASVPPDVYIGIVNFSSKVTTALAPTQDRAKAKSVIDALTLAKGTRLYEAMVAAIAASGSEGQRSILVLSDGADETHEPATVATDAITASKVLVDVVSVDQGTPAGLQALATAGKGQVIPADHSALAAAFDAEAQALARQIQVTVQVPASVTALQAAVVVSLPTSSGTLQASAFGTVQGRQVPVPAPSGKQFVLPSWVMYVAALLIFVGLLALLVLVIPKPAAPMSAADRVTAYTARTSRRAQRAAAKAATEDPLASAKSAAAGLLKRNVGLEETIARRLDAAGSELKPAEWLLLHAGIIVAATVVLLLVGQGNVLLGLLGLVMGAVIPWLYLGLRRGRRRGAFNAALPDTLQLLSGSLAAGLSLAQGIDTIVKEGTQPIADEFRRVLVETRLGVTLEDALEGVAERFESKDFAWVVMAIKIQRQVGGNLAELLDTVAATMREREYIRRQVNALAAEGKLSAYVLGGLPPAFLLYLLVANRSYVSVLFQNPIGWFMLIGAGLWLAVGAFWMSRLVKVEV